MLQVLNWGMLVVLLATAVGATPLQAPTPSPAVLKTITRVRSTPLCTALTGSILGTIEGLQANDRLVRGSKPLLIQMGKDLPAVNKVAPPIGGHRMHFAGVNDPNPALLLDNEHLLKLTNEIVHNLAIIDSILNDSSRFPAAAKTDDDKKLLLLKVQLQAIADEQRKSLNILYGLYDTLSLQQLARKGDGMQGATGGGGANDPVSHDDQPLSFGDVVSGSNRAGAPPSPGAEQDPAVSQAPSELSNNPMVRFYSAVQHYQRDTATAEDHLTQTVLATAPSCHQ